MGKMVNLKIDGNEVKVKEGLNLIEAAETVGIHIPNLCYLKGMKGIGACRLCLVEVEGGRGPVIACNIKAREGMDVQTKTDKVQEIRKFVIDLILSMHPLDCMTCTKAGVCNLQKYAYDFEIKESSFSRKSFGYPTDESNPFIKRDPEYCILCGKCIRVCKAQDTKVLDFKGRGVGAKVVTGNEKPLQESSCTFCGSCIDVCPVNALVETNCLRKGREWEYEKINSVCYLCGCGCDIILSVKDGEVVKINSGAPDGASERFICATGRFGFDHLNCDMRVSTPLKRVNGELQETTWDDATKIVAGKLSSAGADAAFICSGNIMNEDALLLKQLATDVVKTGNCDSSVSLYSDYEALKGGGADIDSADLLILVGIAPDQWKRFLPAVDAVVRKRVNAGAKLIVINSVEPKISGAATAFLEGDEVKILEEFAQALISGGVKAPKEMIEALAHVDPSDAVMEASVLFKESKSPLIISSPPLYKAASNLSLIRGNAVTVPLEANAKGVVMMGLGAGGKKFSDIVSSSTQVLYAVGEVPVSKRPDTGFLIVQNTHMTDLSTQADIVLPSTTPYEADGTIVDYLGRIKEVKKALDPAADARSNAEIIMDIASAMGTSLKHVKASEVKRAVKSKLKPAFSPFAKDKGLDIDEEEFTRERNRTTVNCSRLLWLKELEESVSV